LIRYKEHEITTEFYFWRIGKYIIIWKLLALGFIRFYVWTMSCMFWLFANAFVGPFGLRALCGTKEFHPDVRCNDITGEIYPSEDSSHTVISLFLVCLEDKLYQSYLFIGMRDSRARFEGSPDTGFFGKKFARLCNYIEVYIFRFIFVGLIIVLCLFPLSIIVASSCSFILALTAWLWIPIVLILQYFIR
jgi:hypothetical protein